MQTSSNYETDSFYNWLRNRYSFLPDPQLVHVVGNFSIAWNILERDVLSRRAGSESVLELAKAIQGRRLNPPPAVILACNYWLKRYGLAGGYRDRLFNSRNSIYRPFFEKLITSTRAELDISDLLALGLLVVHRLRNNLFHGNKETHRINEQLEAIKHATIYCCWLIDHQKSIFPR